MIEILKKEIEAIKNDLLKRVISVEERLRSKVDTSTLSHFKGILTVLNILEKIKSAFSEQWDRCVETFAEKGETKIQFEKFEQQVKKLLSMIKKFELNFKSVSP
jgi:hypothetical protein